MKLNHLLIISILALSFSVSFLLRSQAADFGFELNEFDPFFNYRATQYIVDNGFEAYYEWDDALSWYPYGRDVSSTSQVILHFTTAITYWIFGGGSDLYDFTIIFPVVFGSLSAIVLFALVRVIGGTTAGLFSALFFSISLPMLIRGPIGWFKSEPLGLFLSLLVVYLLLSGINTQNKKIAILKLAGAGIFTTFSISAWGGNQFFIIPVGIFFLSLPFLRNDHKFLIWAIPLYTIISLVTSLGFERTSTSFVFGMGGISLIVSTIFLVSCIIIQMKSPKNKTRNGLLFLFALLILAPSVLILNSDSQFLPLPSHRYMNALNPFLTTTDPLADSVSEHATTTIEQSFLFHSVLMIFAAIGIWLIIKNIQEKNSNFIKNEMYSFSLILGLGSVYVSSTFVRLEVFASIGIIILASLGLAILSKEFLNSSNQKKSISKLIKLPYIAGIIILLIIPLVYPPGESLMDYTKSPPTILSGGSNFKIATTDWLDSLEWLKHNTPKEAVIASWWDYGYWISTMAERASLADNSTLHTDKIQNIAKMLLQNPNDAWESLNEMGADYVLVFVAGQRLVVDHNNQGLYSLNHGGDESKKQWFMRIAGLPLNQYLHADGISGTDYFWNETVLGKMFPFSPIVYLNPYTEQQSEVYRPGYTPIYVKDIKFPKDGDGPLRLVYSSPSFDVEKGGEVLGIFIYEINKDYVPLN